MPFYIDVIVDISVAALDRIFQYNVPETMIPMAKVGASVIVPFGTGNRRVKGYIIGRDTRVDYDPSKIKDILSIETKAPGVAGELIALAAWLKDHTGCTMAQALKTVLPVRKKVKAVERITYVVKDETLAAELLEKSRKDKRETARRRFLEALLTEGSLGQEIAAGVLGISASTVNTLIKRGAVEKVTQAVYRDPVKEKMSGWGRVSLNHEQQAVSREIWEGCIRARQKWSCSDGVHLLHGVTGSGKTEVYMDLIEKVLLQGRSVIVLIPEISLTLQTVSRFYERFGACIAVTHSRLSAGEKYDQYTRAERGEAKIMIGPRSALFTPFSDLGMIIIDEEHEGAYKSETTPKYHARDVAVARARMAGATVVLGSATPSVVSYDRALRGEYGLHELTRRAREGSVLPEVEIVDLRREFKLKNRGILSGSLKAAIEGCLERKEQVMLFLNRRGFAGFVSCRSCGYVFGCRHCDVSMTAHYGKRLKCHYCGYEADLPDRCPSCGSPYIASFGTGTQKVEDFIKKTFPAARVLRMDKDTTTGKDDMANLLQTFAQGGADILIGTQMIVKGHDFENVTLVGVIAADLSIFTGDFMSAERTFQLLTQAAGRAGRGKKAGKVIIQTYQPEHYSISCAADQDYRRFFDQEIAYRRLMHYPPRSHMLMILMEGPDDRMTQRWVQAVHRVIRDFGQQLEILGPSRAGIPKGKDMYRFVFYIKDKDEDKLIRLKDQVTAYMDAGERPAGIYLSFDFDPMTTA